MAGVEFDPDLYRGTAADYERFRVAYPRELIEDLLEVVAPSGEGRALDLACGTGQIAFAIAERFGEVWAVDQEPDMIEVVRKKARSVRPARVDTVVSPAEDLHAPTGAFELVAIGNAFHRLRRDEVAANAFRWLRPHGYIALLWGDSPWAGDARWQSVLAAVLGVEARVPAGWDQPRRERPDVDVLAAPGFQAVHSSRFPTVHEWTVDALIGFVYSTSSLPRGVLGDRAEEFESDLRRELADLTVASKLHDTIEFAYELARRPA